MQTIVWRDKCNFDDNNGRPICRVRSNARESRKSVYITIVTGSRAAPVIRRRHKVRDPEGARSCNYSGWTPILKQMPVSAS